VLLLRTPAGNTARRSGETAVQSSGERKRDRERSDAVLGGVAQDMRSNEPPRSVLSLRIFSPSFPSFSLPFLPPFPHLSLQYLLSPDMAAWLSESGFFGKQNSKGEIVDIKENSLTNYYKNVVANVSNLSQEQRQQAQEILHDYYSHMVMLKEQRSQASSDLSQYLASGSKTESSLDLSGVVAVENLRVGLATENAAFQTAMSRLLMTLTPLQEAEFFIRVAHINGSMIRLRAVWQSLSKTRSRENSAE